MRRRLDVEMVRRGMAGSRTEAQLAIRAGTVVVGGRPAAQARTLVSPEESISIGAPSRRFVSRAGEKLDAALDRFAVEAAGRNALDAGASTGGFTDCLLERGAAHVVAVDVAYGLLDWRLRGDGRVTVLERTNVRHLRPEDLPYAAELVTADLSFISLALALPALIACAAPRSDFILLVKPQFEARKDQVGTGGVVSDPATWREVLGAVVTACRREGVAPMGVMASPLVGPAGNVEFLLHGRVAAVEEDGSAVAGRDPGIEEALTAALEARASRG